MISSIILLIAAIFYVASTSIGIQCYNADSSKDMKSAALPTFNFLIVNLVSAILTILLAFVFLYLRY